MVKLYYSLCGFLCILAIMTFSVPTSLADEPDIAWVQTGWSYIDKGLPAKALRTWQEGMNRQPDHRLFPVLGAFAHLPNAIVKLRLVGEKHKALIIHRSSSSRKLFFVLSALDIPPDQKEGQEQLLNLISSAKIKGKLLSNEARHFKTRYEKEPVSITASDQKTVRRTKQSSGRYPKARWDHKRAIRMGRNGEYDKALNILSAYIKSPDQFPSIAVDYIVILNWAARHEKAVATYEALPESVGKPDYLQLAIADSYFQLGQYQISQDLFASAAKVSPDNTKAVQGNIESLIALEEYSCALNLFEQYSFEDRGKLIWLQLVSGHYQEGFGEEGVRIFV